MAIEALLLSSSRVFGGEPYDFARDVIAEFFADRGPVCFAPFAVADQAAYVEVVRAAFARLGLQVVLLDRAAAESARGVFVGGGNSFRLLKALQSRELLEPLRERARAGLVRYMGSSAGSNMACPSLRTTNDMPIVQPASFAALGLVPFQINPHYADPAPGSQLMGETREQRIAEFLEENDVAVVGLREGAWLRRSDQRLTLGGIAGARVFRRGAQPEEVSPGTDLSWLLALEPRFDVPADP